MRNKLRIAVVGCCHGRIDTVYAAAARLNPDVVLICGDFQAVRDSADLDSMSVPAKYRSAGDFPAYFRGQKQAPFLTLVVGGNHEASRYMSKLPYGGWLAPNIYYLGYAGCVQLHGIRIAALSGIWHESDYMLPHFEQNFTGPERYSAYHVRELDVSRLKQLTPEVDVFMSHDWPRGIENSGNFTALLAAKPWIGSDMVEGKLGSPPGAELLAVLRPRYWFAAHLHTRFEAKCGTTSFLALDKPGKGRKFVELVDVSRKSTSGLRLDPQWAAIVGLKGCIPNPGPPEKQTAVLLGAEVQPKCSQ